MVNQFLNGSSSANNSQIENLLIGQTDEDYLESTGDYEFYYEGDLDNLRKPWIQEPHFIPVITIYGAAFLIGLIGNSLVIFAMLGDRKSRSVTASFMVSLAVADLLYLMVCVPFETSRYFIGHWEIGPILCKLSGYVEMLSALASVLNLTAVSIERYIVIVHPILSRAWCTLGNSKKILPGVWLIALVLSSPTFHVMDTERNIFYQNDSSVILIYCADGGIKKTDRIIYAVYQFIVMFVAPTIILFFCYVFVIHSLWISSRALITLTRPNNNIERNGGSKEKTSSRIFKDDVYRETCPSKAVAPSSPDIEARQRLTVPETPSISRHSHIRSRRSLVTKATREHSVEVLRARKQVIKMLITIIIVFLACWGPKLMFRVLQRMNVYLFHQSAFTAKIVFECLPYIQSCLNPIIYGFMSRNFRKSMQTACRHYVCRRRQQNPCLGRKLLGGSDYELESRTVNGTIQTKISLRTKSSSSED